MSFWDLFNIGKIKTENEKLKQELEKTKKDLDLARLTKQELKYINLKKEIDNNCIRLKEMRNMEDEYAEKIKNVKKELIILEEEILLQNFGLYTPRYNLMNSSSYKNRLEEIRNRQKEMIKNKTALKYSDNWTLDGSKQKGRAMNNDNMKMVLRAFNTECEASIQKVKFNNISSIEQKILKSAESINKINLRNQIKITSQYIALKLEELYLSYEYECKKEEEREEQRLIREQMKEEAKRLAELEKEKAKVRKEKEHLENALNKYREQLEFSANKEDKDLLEKIEEIEIAINKAIDKEKDIENNEANNRAGYVYVISNIGSFGENVFKIGMTRRLDPIERVKELSSASVPFKFDIHAIIFSEDAPALENALHKEFANKRVNMVNKRKEFFNVSIEEIEDVVKSNHNSTIEFTKLALADEYRETKAMKQINKNKYYN